MTHAGWPGEGAIRGYTVLVIPEPKEGGYPVTVPALPGCYTQGENWEEALAHARDAIPLYLEDMVASGEPIPDDVAPPRVKAAEV